MPSPFISLIGRSGLNLRGEGFAEKDLRGWKESEGKEVRGDLVPIQAPKSYVTYKSEDVDEILAHAGKGALVPATAYEVVHYGKNGWDQRLLVTGFGSFYKTGGAHAGYPHLYKPNSIAVENYVKWPREVRLLAVRVH
jgi:hypothetical protein